jgi:hypothetical protein
MQNQWDFQLSSQIGLRIKIDLGKNVSFTSRKKCPQQVVLFWGRINLN